MAYTPINGLFRPSKELMSEQDNENLDSLNQATEEVVKTEVVEETVADTETEDNQPKYTETEMKMFARAKKAEAELRKLKAEVKEQPKETKEFSVSLRDQIALINAKVNEDDIEDVMEYARFKNIPITEALKAPVVKATLKDKEEGRRTAEATNTSGSNRVSTQITDEQLVQMARDGKEVDPEKLATASMNLMLKAKKR